MLLLLAACNGNGDTPSANDGREDAAPTPTLTNAERIEISQTLAALQSSTDIPAPTLTSDVTGVPIDPGPYFTPQRPSPSGAPIDFMPPEDVAGFQQYWLRGVCQSDVGQTTSYQNEAFEVVQLQCLYRNSARLAQNEIQILAESGAITGDPLLYKLQGGTSFILGATGDGFLYGWTHDNWVFIVRSPLGRAPLDTFMQAFPY